MPPPQDRTALGYQALVEQLDLECLPLPHVSYCKARGGMRIETEGRRTIQTFPSTYAPANTVAAQLEFALKYDGVNLEVLRAVFERCDRNELADSIRATPTGKYTRRIWFLFEWLTGRTLDVPDAGSVGYVDAIGDAAFAATPVPSQRHRVRDDLPGHPDFCPLVRKTERLRAFLAKNLEQRVQAIVGEHDAALLHRAAQFLYLKETKSSFEIEREHPDRQRTLRFVELLRSTTSIPELSAATLVELQKAILDPRYAKDGYRSDQNYVGQTLTSYREHVHYVCPRPQDVDCLMAGWLRCNARLAASTMDPVVQAAVLGFGFVYIHPFDDGNGRLHRYIIHHVLSRSGFTPEGLVMPVSAGMLARPRDYDSCLEAFSRPLLPLLDHHIDGSGRMTVHTDSIGLYRYFDATPAAEYLYETVERTIDTDLRGEIDYLVRFDRAWRSIRDVVDMPDRRLELFLGICMANGGRLSASKRSQFGELTDAEVARMEAILHDTGL